VVGSAEKLNIKVGEEFKPSTELKKLYHIYLLLLILLGILPWYLPVMIFSSVTIKAGVSILVIALIVFSAYWIEKYYDTIAYRIDENEIIWRRGVWFKNTGVVPYHRITNIDIAQGPIARRLGIGTLKIQTAGYSGKGGAEMTIEGINNFEELKELIMEFVKGKKVKTIEVEKDNINMKILDELIKIRKLLEKIATKSN